MRLTIVVAALFLLFSVPAAADSVLDFTDWTASPEKILGQLRAQGVEAKSKIFHKTGVPYVCAELAELGNRWKSTFYFDEEDQLNQISLQKEKLTRSGVTRIQKLAVAEFGEDYQVKSKDHSNRRDVTFSWSKSSCDIVLNSAYYKSKESTVWLTLRPRTEH